MREPPASQREIQRFANLLKAGEVAAFPTETVYGLGADAANSDAVLKIYETKGRPRFNPLIVHCADLGMAETLAVFRPLARRLAERFWPGPLTLVLPRKDGARVCDIVTAGLDTVGLRVPGHPVARELIRAAGLPLAAPSANPSGRLSPTTAGQVRRAFGDRVPVLDGGPCAAGLESTILAVNGDDVVQLRAGALSRDEIEAFLERPVAVASADSPVSAPGMLASHYAPKAKLRLNAVEPEAGESYLAFGPGPVSATGRSLNLSQAGDLREAARNLFAMLHALDRDEGTIAVAPIPEEGLGEAINDRLRRAAAPKK